MSEESSTKTGEQNFHSVLVTRAGRWLRHKAGCAVVLKELVCNSSSREIPDAIGWRGGISILVECKTSRADFLADRRKRFRTMPEYGMGHHRFFLCPPGLITKEDLPAKWGLLYAHSNRIEMVVDARVNGCWGRVSFTPDRRSEIVMLASALRRLPHDNLRGPEVRPLRLRKVALAPADVSLSCASL